MAPASKVTVCLADDQRHTLDRFIRTGTHSSAALRRAQILLKADTDGPDGWSDTQIGKTLGCTFMTVRRVRQQFASEGLDATLHRKRPTGRQYRKLDGKQEAQLVAIACSTAPAGRGRWTMTLLANRLVEMSVVDSIDPATVWRTLKKTQSNRGSARLTSMSSVESSSPKSNSSGSFRPRRTRHS